MLGKMALRFMERTTTTKHGVHRLRAFGLSLLLVISLLLAGGCATLRVTDPARTATEQFLMSTALIEAVDQLSTSALRDREVYIDATYLKGLPAQESSFFLAELRSRMLLAGVRLTDARDSAQIIVEPRSGGIGIDRTEFLLGIPAIYLGNATVNAETGAPAAPLAIPELAIIKRTTQKGFAGVAFVAYWRDSGELIATSGPFVGRTMRQDYWFFGSGPRTIGDIPTANSPE